MSSKFDNLPIWDGESTQRLEDLRIKPYESLTDDEIDALVADHVDQIERAAEDAGDPWETDAPASRAWRYVAPGRAM